MDSKGVVRISVREIIEFVLKSGDLSSEYVGMASAIEGTRAHRVIQKSRPEEYVSEVPITYVIEGEDVNIELSGRIDGIYKYENRIIIDEIKSTSLDLDLIDENYNMLHWAQAKFYAFIYAVQNDLPSIEVQLTYINRNTHENKSICREFSTDELIDYFYDIVNRYMAWIERVYSWINIRNSSIRELQFPYSTYRKGQRELAVAVYRTITTENKLYAQAPTGIGKTLASTFPAVKSMGEGHISKIFYLTAKTITRTVAESAFENMRNSGLKLKTLILTAKEKICFKDGKCDSASCPYAAGYFDRINGAVEDIFSQNSFNMETIQEYARKHMVCPFEFSLDISLWVDCIICDYNYVFDPRVYLKRFFMSGKQEFVFLIDEAHNLVDRAREMFSAELSKKPFLELKRAVKKEQPDLYKCINDINSYFIELRKKCEESEEGHIVQKEPVKDLYKLVRKFADQCDDYFERRKKSHFKEELLEVYFNAVSFIRISEYYDERYVTYIEKQGNDVKIKLYCLDPSYLLQEASKRGKAAVFFSATLAPMDYFIYMLGGSSENLKARIPSPFPQSNLCLLLADNISTRYRHREMSYEAVSDMIYSITVPRRGNYLAYFPSYKYMNEVIERFNHESEMDIIYQTPDMGEAEKEGFLSSFSENNENTLVGFGVLGGMFSEGIDLVGDRLSGAVIVGVGLPQVCIEREIIRQYFQEKNGMGFEYSYIYPGMNKVLQAAGRVIRTEKDRGVVLLIDERFSNYNYKNLFPPEWSHVRRLNNTKSLIKILEDFWQK